MLLAGVCRARCGRSGPEGREQSAGRANNGTGGECGRDNPRERERSTL